MMPIIMNILTMMMNGNDVVDDGHMNDGDRYE